MCCPIGYHEYELGIDMGDYKFIVDGHKYNYNVTKDPKVTNALTQLNRIQCGIDKAHQSPSTGSQLVNPIRKQVTGGIGKVRTSLNDSFRSKDSVESINRLSNV